MTRRDWWFGVALVVAALLLHAVIPRYEWRTASRPWTRADRWTGRLVVVVGNQLVDVDPAPDVAATR